MGLGSVANRASVRGRLCDETDDDSCDAGKLERCGRQPRGTQTGERSDSIQSIVIAVEEMFVDGKTSSFFASLPEASCC